MKKEVKYVKLIFEKGSVIFRRITSHNFSKETQISIITFEDKSVVTLDMLYLQGTMGKLIKFNSNL